MILCLVFAALNFAEAGISFTIGTDDYYLLVEDYDYLPTEEEAVKDSKKEKSSSKKKQAETNKKAKSKKKKDQ